MLVAPGLHYAGPDDPRLDRFCRILAAAGHLVIAPFIPDYLALTPGARAIRDFERVLDAVPRWSEQRPWVFSISFGSLLALALAAKRGDELRGLILFGGYAELGPTLHFCLTGEVIGRLASGRTATRDPLNQPVVLANILGALPAPPDDPGALVAAWRRYVEATWGRPEMKARARFTAVAEAMAPDVPASIRELFLIGVGARPGAAELAGPVLAAMGGGPRDLDPSPYLSRVRCRVELVHGADDDVIPFEQSHALAAALPNARVRVHVTGAYGHTGASRLGPIALLRELSTMLRILHVLAA
jgi:pimeloyl-ACP methyl ester carboxylesterase